MNDILFNKPISHSSLNIFNQSPLMYKRYVLKQLEEEDTTAFRKGNAFDCLITEPDEFNNRFAISTVSPPSGMLGKFVELYLENIDKMSEDDCRQYAYQFSGFKLKYEAVINKFEHPDIVAYIQFQLENKDKTILSQEEFDIATAMVAILNSDDRCKGYMMAKDNPLMDVHDQLKLEWKLDGGDIDAIGALDRLVIDHSSKSIHIIDFKTTGKSMYSFASSYIKYGYFRQAALYYDAVCQNFSDLNYTIHLPVFIVIETSLNNPPLIYRCTEKSLEAGKSGGILKSGLKVKGYQELVSDLLWHRENDQWEVPKDAFLKGYLDLDPFV